jgi:serine/threonine protein kinase
VSRDYVWDRWKEVDELLERVLDRPSEEQDSFLNAQCKDDPELLRTVRALAQISEQLKQERMGPGSDLIEAAFVRFPVQEPDSPGARDDGAFERQVAVKVLRREFNPAGVLVRFKQERQILASLSHGAIAQMIDGGTTEAGRPALIMEYVDGVPIDRYADGAGLGVEGRIELILQVADAVEYAHRHRVVHGDLKPSNILVTGDGSVKLLDFGVAKLLKESGTEDPQITTLPEARFVTPEYAAPEQLLGEPVSAQTDQYSLAGLLYELLTGIRPYSRRRSESVLNRMIRGDEPTAPSTAVFLAQAEKAREARDGIPLARIPKTSHDALSRRLSGDLDAILLRALRTRPEARYISVAALREDLERHLAGHPVSARGDAALYRAQRFVRRHRIAVGAAAGAVLVAAIAVVGLALQRQRVLVEWNRAEVAAEAASRDAETSRQVTAFLIDLFQASDPLEARGDTLSVRSLLDRGATRIDTELANQPAVRAELFEALGQVYINLGDFDEGVPLLQRAVGLRRDSIPGQPGLVGSLLHLAAAQRAGREFAPSMAVSREAIREAAKLGDGLAVGRARIGLGSALMMLERVDSAEIELRAGVEALAGSWDAGDLDHLNALTNLAGMARRRGKSAEAEGLYREAIERQRRAHRMDAEAFSITLNNLAVLLRLKGDYDGSYTLYQEAFDTLAIVLGPGHPTSLLVSGNMAGLASRTGRTEEGLTLYRERVAAARQQWPQGHWRTAETLMNLGGAFVSAGRAEEAVRPLSEALDLAIVQIGARHSWTNVYRGWLGAAAALTSRHAEAEELFAWSLDGLSQYEDLAGDLQVKAMLRSLVEVMEIQGLLDEAGRYRALVDLSEPATE